ncbi:hypothetical protein BJ166DRAFT_491892 [Pestalotiopsis sp. NC0098]|nr:hypothetical protein BJ166DRAFT_491892 [Pestalotiopsis sp. NC0098]
MTGYDSTFGDSSSSNTNIVKDEASVWTGIGAMRTFIVHCAVIGYEEHIGAEAYGDAEAEPDPEIYVANHEVDATDDDYVGDGGEYALGYPSGGEDEVPFEIEPDYDASDADEVEESRHGSSHSGHYFQDQHDDDYRKEDALVGSGGSYDASGSDDDYDYGRHDGYDRYGYETGVFSGNSITSDLSAGSPESTAPLATNQSAITAPTLPSVNVVLPATRVTLQTIPTSDTHLCPDFDGQCLNGNIIRCDRVLSTDTNAISSRYECEFGPGLSVTSERACHESCRRQGDCSGWQMIQTQTFDGSGGDGTTYDCCFVHGHPHLQDPLPQQSRFSTFPAYYSYGLDSYCTDQSPGLCPEADNGCVDEFLVRCGRDLEQDVAAVPGAYTARHPRALGVPPSVRREPAMYGMVRELKVSRRRERLMVQLLARVRADRPAAGAQCRFLVFVL